MKNWLWAKSFVILKSKGEKECAYAVIQLAKKLAWRKKQLTANSQLKVMVAQVLVGFLSAQSLNLALEPSKCC